jgi:hypothetical protein
VTISRCATGSASADYQVTPKQCLHWRSQWHTFSTNFQARQSTASRISKGEIVMWNIIIGIAFVIGGLSGQLALRGFDSPEGLAAFGGILIVWGIVQTVRAKNAE